MDELYESDEMFTGFADDTESDESDEAIRRRRPFRPRVPTGRGLYSPRPNTQHVTQVQLQTALARVGRQIKENADATRAVGAKVNETNARLDKEAAERKKQMEAAQKAIKKSRETTILPLLLASKPKLDPQTVLVPVLGKDAAGKDVVTQVPVLAPGTKIADTSDNLLPLVLLMGMGGDDFGKGGDDNTMLLMALVLMNR